MLLYLFQERKDSYSSSSPPKASFTVGHTANCQRNGKVVNHAITMVWDTAAIIDFISYINHDSLTFIVEVMGLFYGLGDSSSGDKCCYLFRASTGKRIGYKKSEIVTVCATKDLLPNEHFMIMSCFDIRIQA